MRVTVPAETKAILSLVRGAGSRVHVAFEEGTQAQWLHDLLEPHVERVVVCNVRGKSEVSNKSDRIDAAQLAELLRVGSLKTVYHGAAGVLTLQELVRNYNSLVEDATRVMLRIKALFRAHAIRTPMLKSIFKGAATAAAAKAGPLQDLYEASVARHQAGVGEGDAGAQDRLDRVAPVEERRALGSGQADDANGIALGADDHECGRPSRWR